MNKNKKRLTASQVRDIKKALSQTKERKSVAYLSGLYAVSIRTIYKVKNNQY